MEKILIAEDDREINRLISDYLSTQDYETASVYNGLDALRYVREGDFSLILLDLMLPYKSGDMVLSGIREFSDIPVIIVSAKSETHSKIDLMRLGADDYITKPFDLDELLVRIEAVLRRTHGKVKNDEEKLTYKNIVLDISAGQAYVCGKPLQLTGKEFAILALMLKNPSKLWSKSALFESVWGEPYFGDDNTIKVHMSNIRAKLKAADAGEEYIETVWGMGYRLVN